MQGVGAGLQAAWPVGAQDQVGQGLGCRPCFLWVFSWNVAGPCWLFNAVPYKRIFFKLYIYKNRSYTVYIKIDVRNMYECIK